MACLWTWVSSDMCCSLCLCFRGASHCSVQCCVHCFWLNSDLYKKSIPMGAHSLRHFAKRAFAMTPFPLVVSGSAKDISRSSLSFGRREYLQISADETFKSLNFGF